MVTMAALLLTVTAQGVWPRPRASAATGPAPPQYPGQFDPCGDGDNQTDVTNAATAGANDRSACVDPGQSLFVDPGGGNFGASIGPCRYVTNNAGKTLYVPLSLPQEYQYFRAGVDNAQGPPNVQETICCRPSQATVCQGATGGTQQASIQGTGAAGYGVLGSTGQATATCSNAPYGNYVDTRTFVCGVTGLGMNADGIWNQQGGDTDTCQPNAYSTYGACSTAGAGGWGVYFEYVYNSCGQLTSSGWFGPACYTTPPCTTNWVKVGCSGSTGTWCDQGTCNSGCQDRPGTCVAVNNSCSGTCSNVTYQSGGCTYTDCQYNWPCQGDPGCTYSGADWVWDCCGSNCYYEDAGVNFVSCSWTTYE
jgi:hypothetical protein